MNSNRFGLALGALLMSLTMLGCRQESAPTPNSVSATDSPSETAVAPVVRQVPTDEECVAFAHAFKQAVDRGDVSAATQMIDWDVLLESAVKGVDAPKVFRDSFVKGAITEVRRGSLARQFTQTVANGGSFEFLNLVKDAGEPRVRFRLLQPEAGVNYQDLILFKNAAGEVVASDLYVFLSAERLSRTMRRMYLLAVSEQPKTVLGKLLSSDNIFVEHADDFRQITQKTQSGDFQGAVEIYQRLPQAMQDEKTVMLLYIQAAGEVDDNLYATAIDRFREVHPRDSCIDIISIDGHLIKGQYDEALAAVDRVDHSIGQDPYMDVLRVNINLMRGNVAEAKKIVAGVIQEAPQLIDAYWALITISLQEKDFAATRHWLGEIEDKFQLEFGDLSTVAEYAEFVASPEYKIWLEQ